jgi:hypothetical protein
LIREFAHDFPVEFDMVLIIGFAWRWSPALVDTAAWTESDEKRIDNASPHDSIRDKSDIKKDE